ncbi:MAG: TonB-dependent receptor [Proteobacteria bacterium]|nr:TonB-dependent receptor [Pseudomonadota bacterium]
MLQFCLKHLAIGSCLAGLCGSAFAADVDTGGDELTEIVVTAQKTSEVASKIPISISAVSAAQLSEEHITDYSDLSRAVPNVSFTNFGGTGQSNIEIRGISSQAGSATTGIYLDDVPINIPNIYAAGATEPRFFDIDRVEVLRGPQGTLYGAGSMGGTIHFVSVRPDLNNFSGSVHSTVGGTQGGGLDYEADSVANLMLSKGHAALRLGALYDRESGWIDRVDPNGSIVAHNINHQDTSVVRATLELHPTDALTITPAAFVQRVTTGGQDLFGLSLPQFQSPTLLAETNRDEYAITGVTVQYDFGWSDLTSVSGYFWRNDHRLIDGTFYDSVFLGSLLQQQFGYGGDTVAALAAPSKFYTNVNQLHQEIRLASNPSGPDDRWSWITGLFYSRTRTQLLDDEHIPGLSATFQSVYGDTPLNLLGASFPDDLIYYAFSEFVNTQYAGFGQATYRVTPNLKVTAGVRYEQANEDLSFDTAGYFGGGTPSFSGSAKGHATTPKVALSYELTPTGMVYASAAEGFRDGGVNRPVPIPLCSADLANLGLTQAPGSYKSDKLWSYELGAKGRALQDSLSISAALFDIRWTNIQTDIILPTCSFDIKDNIGSAESRGVELELTQRLLDHLSISLGGNYTSAKITSPVTVLGVQRGDRVPGVPDYSVATALEYTHTLTAIGAKGLLRTNAQWIGSSQGIIQHGDPDFERPSYFVMGASGGLRWPQCEISLFVTNLLGQRKVIQRPNIASVEYGVTVRPRTFGIGGSYSF